MNIPKTCENYAPSLNYSASISNYHGKPISPESRKHLTCYLNAALWSRTHDRCEANLDYAKGFIGALTIEGLCTLQEQEEAWSSILRIQNLSRQRAMS